MDRSEFSDKLKDIYEGDKIRLHIRYIGISETEIRQGTFMGVVEKKVASGAVSALKMRVTSTGRIVRGEDLTSKVDYVSSYVGSSIERIYVVGRRKH